MASEHYSSQVEGPSASSGQCLEGVRVKFDPVEFRDSILRGLEKTGTDMDAVWTFLDSAGSKLDYLRYGETLFDILIVGRIMVPGENILQDVDPSTQTEVCIFCVSNNIEVLKGYIDVFDKLIRRYMYLEKSLETVVRKIFHFLTRYSETERNRLAIVIALLLSNKLLRDTIFNSLLQNHLIIEKIASDFIIKVFKIYIDENDENSLITALKNANLENRLMKFLSFNKRTQKDFEHILKKNGLEDVFLKVQESAKIKRKTNVEQVQEKISRIAGDYNIPGDIISDAKALCENIFCRELKNRNWHALALAFLQSAACGQKEYENLLDKKIKSQSPTLKKDSNRCLNLIKKSGNQADGPCRKRPVQNLFETCLELSHKKRHTAEPQLKDQCASDENISSDHPIDYELSFEQGPASTSGQSIRILRDSDETIVCSDQPVDCGPSLGQVPESNIDDVAQKDYYCCAYWEETGCDLVCGRIHKQMEEVPFEVIWERYNAITDFNQLRNFYSKCKTFINDEVWLRSMLLVLIESYNKTETPAGLIKFIPDMENLVNTDRPIIDQLFDQFEMLPPTVEISDLRAFIDFLISINAELNGPSISKTLNKLVHHKDSITLWKFISHCQPFEYHPDVLTCDFAFQDLQKKPEKFELANNLLDRLIKKDKQALSNESMRVFSRTWQTNFANKTKIIFTSDTKITLDIVPKLEENFLIEMLSYEDIPAQIKFLRSQKKICHPDNVQRKYGGGSKDAEYVKIYDKITHICQVINSRFTTLTNDNSVPVTHEAAEARAAASRMSDLGSRMQDEGGIRTENCTQQ